MPDQDDSALVAAYRAGRGEAFEAIVHRHYPRLLARAYRRCGGGALAEDAVQSALVRAHRYLRTTPSVENLGAWLRRILDNCANDLLRKRGREINVEQPLDAGYVENPTEGMEHGELASLVREGIERLPEIYREPLRLHFLRGIEAKEVARLLDDNIHSVKSRIARGRRELRRRLESTLHKGGYL